MTWETERVSVEAWQAEKITKALTGQLCPDRATVIEELNRKRRREGIYARTAPHWKKKGGE